MNKQPTLYLMFGYPGAGKTTVAKVIQEITGAAHASSDDIRIELFPKPTYTQAEHSTVYATLDGRVEKLLADGKDVIYDANLNRYQHREEKYAMCERTGARAVLIWVQAPKDFARERAVMRGHHHLVPVDETFESMFERVTSVIEDPRPEEPTFTLDGRHVTKENVKSLIQHIATHEPQK